MIYIFPNIQNLIELHNSMRQNKYILWPSQPLKANDVLMNYAQHWAVHMADNNNLEHSKMSNIISLGFNQVGENILSGHVDENIVMNKWAKSLPHKNNIMNSQFNQIGCGFAYSSHDIPYWCVCFGAKP